MTRGAAIALIAIFGCGEQEVELFPGDASTDSAPSIDGGIIDISQRDPERCGPTETHCEDDEYCVMGVCECRQGLVRDGEDCEDPSADGESCGPTAMVCPALCADNVCVSSCPPGTTICGDGCVDLDAHPLHCGECGRPCGSTSVCVAGVCLPFRATTCESCPCDTCGASLCCSYPSTTDPICVEGSACPTEL